MNKIPGLIMLDVFAYSISETFPFLTVVRTSGDTVASIHTSKTMYMISCALGEMKWPTRSYIPYVNRRGTHA